MNKESLDKVFNRTVNKKYIHEAILLVENTNGDFSYSKSYGEKTVDTPFLIASITKLFTSACIFILREQNKLSLDDRLRKYFSEDTLHDLHFHKGRDYTTTLTISHLLSQTSGLPGVFEEGADNIRKRVIQEDIAFRFDEIITMTKDMKPHFAPDSSKRAHYADINFDLLGKIIENITHLTLKDAFMKMIYIPLGLKETYFPTGEADFVPHVYLRDNSLHRPKFIGNHGASGGIVSTARELMVFLKAFFGGKLFDLAVFYDWDVSNKLQASMFPIRYGAGYMRIPLGGVGTLFMGKGELIGHSGSSGSFAFYYPDTDLFFVGDVNQMMRPAIPVRMVMQLATGWEK